MDHSEWDSVEFHEALDETETAFADLKRDVADGFFIGLPQLDSDPELKEFRKDPRHETTLKPARAKAETQVEAARVAGLLWMASSSDAPTHRAIESAILEPDEIVSPDGSAHRARNSCSSD